MVKLPEPYRRDRVMKERDRVRDPQDTTQQGIRRKPQSRIRRKPQSLRRKIIAQIQRIIEATEMHVSKNGDDNHHFSDFLRLKNNDHDIRVVCEKCRGPHVVDEFIVPDR